MKLQDKKALLKKLFLRPWASGGQESSSAYWGWHHCSGSVRHKLNGGPDDLRRWREVSLLDHLYHLGQNEKLQQITALPLKKSGKIVTLKNNKPGLPEYGVMTDRTMRDSSNFRFR